MKYFLYLVFIFSILLFFLFSSNIYAQDNSISQQETLPLDAAPLKKDKKEKKPSFSSLDISMKKKKESISFDSEAMKINLKYIENR